MQSPQVPDIVKTPIVRLLKRLLNLAISSFLVKWNKNELRKRKRKIVEKGDTEEQVPKKAEEDCIRRERQALLRELKQYANDTAALEEEMFFFMCEVDILHSSYLQNLTELFMLKRKIALLALSNIDENLSMGSMSFYPLSLDIPPVRSHAELCLSTHSTGCVIRFNSNLIGLIPILNEALNGRFGHGPFSVGRGHFQH